MVGGVPDVITCAKFQIEIFMGYDFTGGRIFDFSIDFSMGLTTVQRYCAACDCEDFIKTCRICQMKSRVTYRDRVPIKPIPRADRVFDHLFVDCAGPLFSSEGPSQNLITHSWLWIVLVDSHFVFH